MKDHRLIDERSLAFGRLIAEKLRANPALAGQARSNLERWLKDCSDRSRATLIEWQEMLDGPLDELLSVLTASDGRAVRLRQSNPFAGVLTPDERFAILREFQARESRAA